MKLKESIFEDAQDNMIEKIYHNDLEELQNKNQSKEYVEIVKKIKNMEKTLFKEFNKENVSKYIEYTNEKVSIEAESQFELGFKTAVKIIFEALK